MVTAIGYGTTKFGTKYWLLKNSWGRKWGEGGYMRLQKDTGKPEEADENRVNENPSISFISQIVGTKINQLQKTNGYDTNYVLDGAKGKELKVEALVNDKKSERVMKISTNASRLQFYTANFVKNEKGKDGFVYQAHSALCLETQAFFDSVNHPNFRSTIVTLEKPYKHVMFINFSTKAPYALHLYKNYVLSATFYEYFEFMEHWFIKINKTLRELHS
ncbi:unnamed protein product [Lupinus luteus]|uniref:Peptidase C1A papain C-terminal domain-containing protein n=1 Tax=Lupinus luteus TaxID=3873 RepID=A0AAV1Y355_LUPLU